MSKRSTKRSKRVRLLIAEDNPEYASALRTMYMKWLPPDSTVDVRESPKQIQDELRSRSYDILSADVDLGAIGQIDIAGHQIHKNGLDLIEFAAKNRFVHACIACTQILADPVENSAGAFKHDPRALPRARLNLESILEGHFGPRHILLRKDPGQSVEENVKAFAARLQLRSADALLGSQRVIPPPYTFHFDGPDLLRVRSGTDPAANTVIRDKEAVALYEFSRRLHSPGGDMPYLDPWDLYELFNGRSQLEKEITKLAGQLERRRRENLGSASGPDDPEAMPTGKEVRALFNARYVEYRTAIEVESFKRKLEITYRLHRGLITAAKAAPNGSKCLDPALIVPHKFTGLNADVRGGSLGYAANDVKRKSCERPAKGA